MTKIKNKKKMKNLMKIIVNKIITIKKMRFLTKKKKKRKRKKKKIKN
jgi:hypothetical protein